MTYEGILVVLGELEASQSARFSSSCSLLDEKSKADFQATEGSNGIFRQCQWLSLANIQD